LFWTKTDVSHITSPVHIKLSSYKTGLHNIQHFKMKVTVILMIKFMTKKNQYRPWTNSQNQVFTCFIRIRLSSL